MSAIGELFVAIAAAFVELLIHLLALVFSSSYLAHHTKGAARVFYALSAASALHLLLGLVLGVSDQLNPMILSILFNKWVMLASLITLIVSLAATVAVHRIGKGPAEPHAAPAAETTDHTALIILSYGVAIAIIIGGIAILTAQTERRTLRDRLCDAGSAKISEQWKERGGEALSLAEQLLKRDIKTSIPCLSEPSK
ncbi:MAG: hypothetical protein WA790_05330 [Sulfitobacter sp.]